MTVKFSGLLAGPLLAAVLAARAVGPTPWPAFGRVAGTRAARLAVAAAGGAVAVVGCWGVVWACYRFRYQPTPTPGVSLDVPAVRGGGADRGADGGLPVGRRPPAAAPGVRGRAAEPGGERPALAGVPGRPAVRRRAVAVLPAGRGVQDAGGGAGGVRGGGRRGRRAPAPGVAAARGGVGGGVRRRPGRAGWPGGRGGPAERRPAERAAGVRLRRRGRRLRRRLGLAAAAATDGGRDRPH